MRLTQQKIIDIYNKIVSTIYLRCQKQRFELALKLIRASARWAYSFNFIYTDANVESLLRQIADAGVPKESIKNPNSEHYVFIDSFAFDNRGLTQQYLRALMSMDADILYILTNEDASKGTDILRELNEYKKAHIYLDAGREKKDIEKSKLIINKIVEFAPAKIFLHLTPWDVSALMAVYKIENVIKYNINLTDHAYWLGASFIDYNIEFRAYGRTVSLERRGLRSNQLLCLPYYPILPKQSEFVGFPPLPKNAIKILTGGSPYKMLGEDGIFFRMMDDILDLSAEAVMMIAGVDSSSKEFNSKVLSMKNSKRVFLLGDRHDINEVFAHCDIFLGTYPLCGGLMSQFAAFNGKPILAFRQPGDFCNQIEGIVNHNRESVQTFSEYDSFLTYAERLLNDSNYRIEEGGKNALALISEACFNREFKKIISSNRNSRWEWQDMNIDYERFAKKYIDLENETHSALGTTMKMMVFFRSLNVVLGRFPSHFGCISMLRKRKRTRGVC